MASSRRSVDEILLSEIAQEKECPELVHVSTDTSLEAASKLLQQKNVLSVPVWDNVKETYVGLFDTLELVRYAAGQFFETNAIYRDTFQSETFASFDFASSTVLDVLLKSKRCSDVTILTPSTKLVTALRALSKGFNHHRILLHDEKSKQYRLLSQMDIVQFIQKHTDQLDVGDLVNRKVEELGLATPLGSVITITTNSKAIEGFYKMVDFNISAVAVVDDNGVLVANLSASDLRGLSYDKLSYVHEPVMNFFQLHNGKAPAKPITCTSSSSLGEVIQTVLTNHIHRIWVVDANQKPIGIVSLTDVISGFLHESLL